MRRKLLFLCVLALWMRWNAAPVMTGGLRPGCGDGVCQDGSCAGAPTGTTPGDGCEENYQNCPSDCSPPEQGGGCSPNWVDQYRVVYTGYEKNWFFYCEHWTDWQVYQTEVNCGLGSRWICDPALDAKIWGWNVNCCFGFYCPGYPPSCAP